MKKRQIGIIAALTAATMLLSGCACKHETWNEADCTTPKTCAECGATEGEALGHDWTDATCETPKTCSRCGATEGETLGHQWSEATCTEKSKCSICGAEQGDYAAHTTTSGKCSTCGEYQLSGVFLPGPVEFTEYGSYDSISGTSLSLGEKEADYNADYPNLTFFTVSGTPVAECAMDDCDINAALYYWDIMNDGSGMIQSMLIEYTPSSGDTFSLKDALVKEFDSRYATTGGNWDSDGVWHDATDALTILPVVTSESVTLNYLLTVKMDD